MDGLSFYLYPRSSIIKTPLASNDYINNLLDAEVYFKLENLQITGSFKLRGATHKISKISSDISAIQNFFKDGEIYTYKIDIGSGGYSIVDYDRNTVDFIEGSFKVASSPTYAINVNDIRLEEGKTEQLCFSRPSQGLLSATSFNATSSANNSPFM